MTHKKAKPKKKSSVTTNPDGNPTLKFNIDTAADIDNTYLAKKLTAIIQSDGYMHGVQHNVVLKPDGTIDDKKTAGLSSGGFINTAASANDMGTIVGQGIADIIKGSRGQLWFDQNNHQEIWRNVITGEIWNPSNNSTASTINKPVGEPSERYWSGGTNEDRNKDSVDIFVDRNEMVIGVYRNDSGVTLPINTEDAYLLIKLLQEAIYVSGQWDKYLKQPPPVTGEDDSSEDNTEQSKSEDDNIY